jgi:hypothetical protein
MKKLIFLSFIILVFANVSFAQIDDIFKKVKKVPGIPDWTPGGAVTTSIKDAYSIVPWLDNFEDYGDPQPVTDFNLGPGYYKTEIQTYCLHAGTYAPTEGSGYLIAPLLGNQSDLISNILKRSEDYPNIAQHDIQELIWGIEAGTKFTDYPVDYQARVKPLLTADEIAKLSVDLSPAFAMVPDELKDLAKTYSDMRKRMVDPNSNYQDLENIAVKNGIPPIGPGSKNVNPGNWAYMKDGFYIRTYPVGYPHTFIEIYRPSPVTTTRDDKNRITSFENDGCKMDIIYDDAPGMDVLSTPGNPDVPIWRIKAIIMHGPDAGNEFTLDNYPAWIVKDKGVPIKKGGSGSYIPIHLTNDPTYAEYQARVQAGIQAHNDFIKYKQEREKQIKGGGSPPDCGEGDFDANKQIHDGLKAATDPTDKKGQAKWVNKNIQNTTDWFNQANDALAGGTGDCDKKPHKFDPSKHVSAPGNTNAQRLGMSARHFGP